MPTAALGRTLTKDTKNQRNAGMGNALVPNPALQNLPARISLGQFNLQESLAETKSREERATRIRELMGMIPVMMEENANANYTGEAELGQLTFTGPNHRSMADRARQIFNPYTMAEKRGQNIQLRAQYKKQYIDLTLDLLQELDKYETDPADLAMRNEIAKKVGGSIGDMISSGIVARESIQRVSEINAALAAVGGKPLTATESGNVVRSAYGAETTEEPAIKIAKYLNDHEKVLHLLSESDLEQMGADDVTISSWEKERKARLSKVEMGGLDQQAISGEYAELLDMYMGAEEDWKKFTTEAFDPITMTIKDVESLKKPVRFTYKQSVKLARDRMREAYGDQVLRFLPPEAGGSGQPAGAGLDIEAIESELDAKTSEDN